MANHGRTLTGNLPKTTQIILCVLLGMTALAVAMGIGRFAFTPILPLMVKEHTVNLSQATFLSSSNYLGYFFGALLLLKNRYHRLMIGVGLVIVTITTFLSATNAYYWLLFFRFLAGIASAWVLVSVSAWVNPWLKQQQFNNGGIIYTGVGLGITVTGILCALFTLKDWQASQIWHAIALIALLVTLVIIVIFRFIQRPASPTVSTKIESTPSHPAEIAVWRLLMAYGLFGFGYILPATFLPQIAKQWLSGQDFLYVWPIFGTAAMLSVAIIQLLKKYELLKVWLVAQILMAIGTFLPAFWHSLPSLMLSATLVGGTFMVVTMAGLQLAVGLNKSYNLAALMTASFALGQLLGPLTTLLTQAPASWQILLPIASIALLIGASLIWSSKPVR